MMYWIFCFFQRSVVLFVCIRGLPKRQNIVVSMRDIEVYFWMGKRTVVNLTAGDQLQLPHSEHFSFSVLHFTKGCRNTCLCFIAAGVNKRTLTHSIQADTGK